MINQTTQAQAKIRVQMKRRLRILGAAFNNESPTIELALLLRKLDPDFDFRPNIKFDLYEYDKVNNPKYTAEPIEFKGTPLEFLVTQESQLNKRTAEAIQGLANNLVWFLNDGWDKESAMKEVFSKSAHSTSPVKELVMKSIKAN